MIMIFKEKVRKNERIHRKRKGKNVEKEKENIKSKSVEPIDTDDDISIDLNLSIDKEKRCKKTSKLQREVDEKWKLWKKRNNDACDDIDRNRFKNKNKKKYLMINQDQ